MKKNSSMWTSMGVSISLGATLFLAACGGGGGSGDGDGGGGGGGGGGTAVQLPTIDGLELVTHIQPYDLDDDGRPDLIMFVAPDGYGSGARIVALMNTPAGFEIDDGNYFPDDLFTDTDRWIESATLIDLNADGHLDIVPHYDLGPSSLGPLVWNPENSRFDALAEFPFAEEYVGYVPVDADGDGDIDLLTHRFGSTDWYLAENKGDVGFEIVSSPIFQTSAPSHFIYHPIVLDVDNDGRDDLIFGGPRFSGSWVDEKVPLTVMLNGVSGWMQADNGDVFSGDVPSFTHLRLTQPADFNADGFLDVAIANHGYDAGDLAGEYNGLLLNDGAGGFTVNTSAPAFNYKGFTHAMAVGDIDNDGDIDIVYTDITGTDVDYRAPVRVLYNDGAGNFSHKSPQFSHDYAVNNELGWTAATLADLDGDSYLDLIVGAMSSKGRNMVFYNDGHGNLKFK